MAATTSGTMSNLSSQSNQTNDKVEFYFILVYLK